MLCTILSGFSPLTTFIPEKKDKIYLSNNNFPLMISP